VSATESIAYTMKRGGGVLVRDAYVVQRRRMLTDTPTLRVRLREELRRRVINQLEKATGLPFDVAIVAVESWRETEEDPEPELNFRRSYYERSVLLVTACIVRAVEYPEVSE
jgi:hypothetical protein